jgi:hypothetical protein
LEDLDTEGAQVVLNMRRALPSLGAGGRDMRALAERCAQKLAQGRRQEGLELLTELGQRLPGERLPGHLAALLEESTRRVREFGQERFEYVVLLFYATGRCLRYLHEQRHKRERDDGDVEGGG